MSVMIKGPEIGVFGVFNCIVKNSDGSVKKDYGWQENLITNNGLSWINNQCCCLGHENARPQLVIGTGSGTPAVSDTALFENLTGSTSEGVLSKNGMSKYKPKDLSIKLNHLYPDGYALGGRAFGATFTELKNVNVTEIGISISGSLATHALITDESGTPTAITILEGEILDIYYIVYAVIPYVTKRGTFKIKKTPDMAVPEQYTEDEYDYQLQIFRAVNKSFNGSYSNYHDYGRGYHGSNYQILVPSGRTEGEVDFDKWVVPYNAKTTTNADFTSSIDDLFNANHANNAAFFVNMDSDYRTKNASKIAKWHFTPKENDNNAAKQNFLKSATSNNAMWFESNKYTIDGFGRTNTISFAPMFTLSEIELRGLFFHNSTLTDYEGHFREWVHSWSYFSGNDAYSLFDSTLMSGENAFPNMMVIFSKKGTGEGIKKEYGWILEVTLGFNISLVDIDSVKIVEATMNTSAKVLDQTYTLDLTYEEGATYNVEVQSLVEGVTPEELVSVNGLTLTQVAQSGSFNVKVTVSKGDMVPRTFTQSFTIASSN